MKDRYTVEEYGSLGGAIIAERNDALARIAQLEAAIRVEHGGRNHEPECPLCAVLLTSLETKGESNEG